MNDELRVFRDRNPGGEHPFVARGLFLSLTLGSGLPLEQQTADGLWTGRGAFGDIKVMLPGEHRTFRHRAPCRFAHLTIDAARLMEHDFSPTAFRPYTQLRDVTMMHLIEALAAEAARGPVDRLFEDAMVRAIAARLAALNGQVSTPPRGGMTPAKLRRALDFIEHHLAHNVSVQQLAQTVDLSTSHFTTLFAASVGEPPHRYQTRRRVERARDLLLAGLSPGQAAVTVGFCDQSHLSRHMRRLLGVTPAKLAKD